jgi:elongation factor P--beta-lysine ligase
MKNPFTEVEKGIESSELSSFHPYWENYVKLVKIKNCFIEQQKLDRTKNNQKLFEMEFSKNTSAEAVQQLINKRLEQCFGAMNSMFYRCKTPSGIEIIN